MKALCTRLAVQHLQLNRATAVEIIDLRDENQIIRRFHGRPASATPPDRLVRVRSIGHPKFEMLFFGAEALRRALMSEATGHELHLGVALTKGWRR